MNDGFGPGIGLGIFIGAMVVMVLAGFKGLSPGQLAEKHCAAVSDRHAFEQCKEEFLK